MKKSESAFLRILDIFSHFLLTNIMWILLCLPIITIVPATTALFGVMKKWSTEGIDAGLFKLFINEFKSRFKKSFVIGLLIGIAGLIILIDFNILLQVDFAGKMVLLTTLIFLTMLYFFISLYVVYILVEYEQLSILQSIKNALFMSISYIFHTIISLAIIGTALIVTYFAPYFLLIIGSVVSFILYHVFNRITHRLNQLKTAE
ncbi:YesL family protein [Aquibacillus salsiterrae]|uniref:DUF624 domain-containing protein n=1 Tax=Aquibacillus salsiterrae TaxID=2950439 RepID=A0A9X4AEK5_9BACI|nr:DUF624 domain-containing protein [Aquibacillus salsiterrae]MDC3417022.1 DUF624 domain-containing protein [Aquibacillus salsiterrae]